MSKWTIITTKRDCYMNDDGNSAFTNEYLANKPLRLYESKELAFNAAESLANLEVLSLSRASGEVSFGIPEDSDYESMSEVKVNAYGEDDTTELVTRRTIREVKE